MASSLNIDDLYSAVEDYRYRAFESAHQDSLNRLKSNLNSINQSYRSSVTQAQTASRISALGQEEKLAAAGLSSGSSSAAPTSGYTESARVASDNNLRSNLNALSLSKMQQEQDAREASTSEMLQAQSDYYNSLTDIGLQKAQSTIDQYNADRTYETTAKNTAYEQAMQRWETYGVVLPADAAILGVAAGTRTASSTYQQAQTSYNESKIKIDQEELKIEREKLALERWKALL